jgi:hypothetical protein
VIDKDIPEDFLKMCVDVDRGVVCPPSTVTDFSDFGIKEDSADRHRFRELDDAEYESKCFYYGLPSRPVLVFRTGTPWKRPTGPEAYHVPKDIRPVFEDQIATVWDKMGTEIFEYLDSVTIMWTTIDVVRFAEPKEDPGPVVLWIGVKPGSLSREDAQVAAIGCEKILDKFKIADVEVAFRESLFTRSARPTLLKYARYSDVTAGVRGPLTPALGMPIGARATPSTEGTGAIYLSEGGGSDKVYILTARHVVFPPNEVPNEIYNRTRNNQPCRQVTLPSPKAFQAVVESIMAEIGGNMIQVEISSDHLEYWQKKETSKKASKKASKEDSKKASKEASKEDSKEDNSVEKEDSEEESEKDNKKDNSVKRERERVEGDLRAAEASIKTLNRFHDQVTKYWSEESQRVIGHIAYSPPITVGTGTKPYTEDWALIELDRTKIDWNNFRGNVIDLGTF